MKWAIFLGSTTVGGGTYVIFEHATRAKEKGVDVTIVTREKVSKEELYWHTKASELRFITVEEASKEEFDVVISTWWAMVGEAYKVKGKQYLYFVQSIESRFAPEKEKPTRRYAESTYMMPMEIITEATWIKEYLEKNYLKHPILVHNGIRKDIYFPDGEVIEKRDPNKLRVLVEGPVDVDFKNVPKTIKLCQKSKADEIWLMTSSEISKYKGVDKVFSRVPIWEAAKIYRSCDVIVKLSYVEGMFGPPLEMFHCGGTAITYDVTGHDEYIVNGVNGLVVHRDDDDKVVEYLNRLKEDSEYLNNLKKGALDTANNWIDWETSSDRFYDAVMELSKPKEDNLQEKLAMMSRFYFEDYTVMQDYLNALEYMKLFRPVANFVNKTKRYIPAPIRNALRNL
ncbi:glycosyltransferase family 4 protein [Butyrivibrio sp. AD3002]|uniref:glycosyltransferase family 4 protein n=1 Tax=Butyrivibrio sp. AD3002 TaxID=1280670 RepID=UPI0003B780DE|nr:glycosyltransferase family 4 protein [Butyrivibrio sp. AD3002]